MLNKFIIIGLLSFGTIANANNDVSITDLKEVTYYLMDDVSKVKESLNAVKVDINSNSKELEFLNNYKVSNKLLNYLKSKNK